MWKIFKEDPLEKSDRIRMRAERRHISAREKSWRRRRRAEAMKSFNKRFNEFIANPFAKRKLSSAERDRRRFKMFARRERKEEWKNFTKRFSEFIAHPFAKRKLTSAERDRHRFKMLSRRERKQDRQKWWAKFKKNPWKTLFPPRQFRTPGGGYYYSYGLTKQELKEIAAQKRKRFRENMRKALTDPDLRQKFIFSYLHSTAYLILAFMLIYVVYQGITILVASSYRIPVIWYYYRLKFPLYTFSPLYTREALVVIFAMGPIMSLMLAFVFLKLYFTTNVILKRFQLFYLWAFICGANMFFGAYISGVLTRTEFLYASEWLFMTRHMFDTVEIVFTAIAIVIMVTIGRMVTPLFLLSSGSVTLVKPEFRLFFILSQVIFPWITAMMVLFLITLPTWYFPLILKTILPGLMLVPSLFLYNSLQFDSIHQSGVIQRTYFKWSIVIVVVAVLFFYRLILGFGIRVS